MWSVNTVDVDLFFMSRTIPQIAGDSNKKAGLLKAQLEREHLSLFTEKKTDV
jgi:hypothetical protein